MHSKLSSRAALAFSASLTPILLLIAGCGSPAGPKHDYSLVPGRAYGPALKTAVIVPLNETLDVPRGAEVANADLYQYLSEYVESKGLAVQTLDVVSYRKATGIAANKAREKMMATTTGKASATLDFSMMVPHLLAELESDADLLIVPNAVIRSGEYTGGKVVRWDGVKRRDRSAYERMSGNTSVVSIQTLIFHRNGEEIFSGFGGLDLIFKIDRQKEKMVLREDRLKDPNYLREGACISVHPFFGAEEECRY